MGNLYCAENALGGGIWDYFDLGENIVCVNAIGENIQQRLNGCDYDSDTMLITDDALLVSAAERYNGTFKVPVCNIQAEVKTEQTLAALDHDTSVNKIGEIVTSRKSSTAFCGMNYIMARMNKRYTLFTRTSANSRCFRGWRSTRRSTPLKTSV